MITVEIELYIEQEEWRPHLGGCQDDEIKLQCEVYAEGAEPSVGIMNPSFDVCEIRRLDNGEELSGLPRDMERKIEDLAIEQVEEHARSSYQDYVADHWSSNF